MGCQRNRVFLLFFVPRCLLLPVDVLEGFGLGMLLSCLFSCSKITVCSSTSSILSASSKNMVSNSASNCPFCSLLHKACIAASLLVRSLALNLIDGRLKEIRGISRTLSASSLIAVISAEMRACVLTLSNVARLCKWTSCTRGPQVVSLVPSGVSLATSNGEGKAAFSRLSSASALNCSVDNSVIF